MLYVATAAGLALVSGAAAILIFATHLLAL
jgi:hypothetical protein